MSLRREKQPKPSLAELIKEKRAGSQSARSSRKGQSSNPQPYISMQTIRLREDMSDDTSSAGMSVKLLSDSDRHTDMAMIALIKEMARTRIRADGRENSIINRTQQLLDKNSDSLQSSEEMQMFTSFLNYLEEEADESEQEVPGETLKEQRSKRLFPPAAEISESEYESSEEGKGETKMMQVDTSVLQESEQEGSERTPETEGGGEKLDVMDKDNESKTNNSAIADDDVEEKDQREGHDDEKEAQATSSRYSDAEEEQAEVSRADDSPICRQCSELSIHSEEGIGDYTGHSEEEEVDSGRCTGSKADDDSTADTNQHHVTEVIVRSKKAKQQGPDRRRRIHYNLIDTPYANVSWNNIYLPKKRKTKVLNKCRSKGGTGEAGQEMVYCCMCGGMTSDMDHAYKANLRYQQVSKPRRKRRRTCKYFTVKPERGLLNVSDLRASLEQKH